MRNDTESKKLQLPYYGSSQYALGIVEGELSLLIGAGKNRIERIERREEKRTEVGMEKVVMKERATHRQKDRHSRRKLQLMCSIL
jgi:hypothetical protein